MPLFWLCLAFITGIALAALITPPAWVWLFLSILTLITSCLEYKFSDHQNHPLLSRTLFRIPISLLAAAFTLAGWRFQAALPKITPHDLAWYSAREQTIVTGIIVSYPEESSSNTVAILEAKSIRIGGSEKPVNGKLELRMPGGFNFSYGDIIKMDGALKSTLDVDAKPHTSYLARRGIYNRMQYPEISTIGHHAGNPIMAMIYQGRNQARNVIYEQIPFPESALLSGILLGIDWNIPDYLQEAYRACGVIHIIAISGFNIALISGLIIFIARLFFSPEKAGFIAIAVITFYTLLVGAEPAVVRAAIMGSMAIPAHYFGRRILALHSLVIVAAIMLIGNPFLLWDISFQLSFLACLGLITLVDPLQTWAKQILSKTWSEQTCQRWMPLLTMIISTFAAQFSVLPVILNLDSQISAFALPANLALLPVQQVLMGLGGLSVFFSFFLPPVGQAFSYAVWPFLAYCNQVALHFGTRPGSEIATPPSLTWIALIAVILTLSFFTYLQIRNLERPKLME